MTSYDEKMTELAARVGNAEHRASVAEAEAAELREQLQEAQEEAGRELLKLRNRAERAEAEAADLRDELDGVELPPGIAAGRRRARRTIVAQSGAGR